MEKAAAALQTQVETIRTERKQERFLWLFSTAALLNVIIDRDSGVIANLTFLLFSLIFLIGAARILEVPWIVTHLERWFDRASVTKGREETE